MRAAPHRRRAGSGGCRTRRSLHLRRRAPRASRSRRRGRRVRRRPKRKSAGDDHLRVERPQPRLRELPGRGASLIQNDATTVPSTPSAGSQPPPSVQSISRGCRARFSGAGRRSPPSQTRSRSPSRCGRCRDGRRRCRRDRARLALGWGSVGVFTGPRQRIVAGDDPLESASSTWNRPLRSAAVPGNGRRALPRSRTYVPELTRRSAWRPVRVRESERVHTRAPEGHLDRHATPVQLVGARRRSSPAAAGIGGSISPRRPRAPPAPRQTAPRAARRPLPPRRRSRSAP